MANVLEADLRMGGGRSNFLDCLYWESLLLISFVAVSPWLLYC